MCILLGSFDTESVPIDVPTKDMNSGADDPKQNSCVGNSDDKTLHEAISEILVMNINISQCVAS
jgi:hypothetical protein